MARLLLVRHGETEFNATRRFMGYSDIELSPHGRRQIEALRGYMAAEKIAAAYASDLQRCVLTARLLTAGRDLEVVPCPELRETNYGVCEGLTFSEIGKQYPDIARQCINFTPELSFPEGEAFLKFADRVIGFLDRVKDLGRQDSVLVVSHNGPIKVLICHLLGISQEHWWQVRVDPASLSIVDITPRGGMLARLNDVAHLADLKE